MFKLSYSDGQGGFNRKGFSATQALIEAQAGSDEQPSYMIEQVDSGGAIIMVISC